MVIVEFENKIEITSQNITEFCTLKPSLQNLAIWPFGKCKIVASVKRYVVMVMGKMMSEDRCVNIDPHNDMFILVCSTTVMFMKHLNTHYLERLQEKVKEPSVIALCCNKLTHTM